MSKAKIIEQLSAVKNLGSTYATSAYDDLGVRTLDDLIAAAKSGKLQTLKGVGAAKEKAILASALELQAPAKPAPTPEKASSKSAAKPKSAPKAKASSSAKKDAPKAAPKAAAKPAPKKAAAKPASKAAAKSAPKKAAAKPAAKSAAKPAPKKPAATAAPKGAAKPAPKKAAPKAEAKKAPKVEAQKEQPEAAKAAKAERPRTTYRPPEPKPRPSIPGLIFKLTKKIIGRLLG